MNRRGWEECKRRGPALLSLGLALLAAPMVEVRPCQAEPQAFGPRGGVKNRCSCWDKEGNPATEFLAAGSIASEAGTVEHYG